MRRYEQWLRGSEAQSYMGLTDRHLNDRRVTKHDLGGDGDDLSAFALLDDLRIQQLWRSNPPRVWESTPISIPSGLIPLTIDMQQRRTRLGQLAAGEQRDVLIRDVGHPFEEQIGVGLGALADDRRAVRAAAIVVVARRALPIGARREQI